mgnify:CR=1 FL=1
MRKFLKKLLKRNKHKIDKNNEHCKNCKFNEKQHCTLGYYFLNKGIDHICHNGELWETWELNK